MVQISKQNFQPQSWEILWEKLIQTIYQSPSLNSSQILLKGLLSHTEQVTLVKRLITAVLLLSEWNPYEIARIFNLSTATVYKIKHQLDTCPQWVEEISKAFPNTLSYQKEYEKASTPEKIIKDLFNQGSSNRVIFSQS